MDDADATTTRGGETAVATLGRSVVLAAVAAEGLASADTFGEPESVEECVNQVRAIVDMSLGGAPVEVLEARELLSIVSPGHFTPSLFAAYTWCLSQGTVALVGSSAAPVLRRQAFHDALGRPPPDEDMVALNRNLVAEVMAVRRAMRAPTIEADLVVERPSKLPRTSSGINHADKAKTLSIEFASATEIALRNVPDTVARATRLRLLLRQGEGATDEDDRDAVVAAATAYQQMCSRQALAAHTLVAADALQLLLCARLAVARGKTLFGVGIASDESPPRGRRFSGYRFQVTFVYLHFIPPADQRGLPQCNERAPANVEQ